MVTIGYTDGVDYLINGLRKALMEAIPSEIDLVLIQNPLSDPDILIYGVSGNKHKQYCCKKICVSGEPGNFSRHHADMIIDCKDVSKYRWRHSFFHYLPFFVLSFCERYRNTPNDLIKNVQNFNIDEIMLRKNKFCAFLYSQSVDVRNRLYDKLSTYRPVDALGKQKNTSNISDDRAHYEVGISTYNDLAVSKYLSYKFVICCENKQLPGYVTEKIISAMLAGAIPIYWGAPDVDQFFNPNSFINISAFSTWDAALDKIKKIDNTPKLWVEMLQQPWFRNNELPHYFYPKYTADVLHKLIGG